MNTPEPCDTCKHLYWDCRCEDDPAYTAECKLELELGNLDCVKYDRDREEKTDEGS